MRGLRGDHALQMCVRDRGLSPPSGRRLLFFYDADHFPGGFKPADATGARLIYDLSPVSALQRATPPPEIL